MVRWECLWIAIRAETGGGIFVVDVFDLVGSEGIVVDTDIINLTLIPGIEGMTTETIT